MKVSPHSSLKHRILGMYFKIYLATVKDAKFNYVDLYAGDAEAECEEAPLKKWDAPFLESILKKAESGKINVSCYLNDINAGNCELLKQKTEPYKKYVKHIENQDANSVYADFLREIPASERSVWFLDPFRHTDLDFHTIEAISKHTAQMTGYVRQPELIINFMTYGMQLNMHDKGDEDKINKALGLTDSKLWKGRMGKKEKAYEVFLEVFLQQLEKLGYKCTYFSIEQTRPSKSHLYYLIFASSVPRAQEIIEEKFKPFIDRVMKDKWVKETYSFRLINKARKGGNTLISDFVEK